MAAVVEFDPAAWRAAFPRYASATDDQLAWWWDTATELVDNGPRSPIPYDPPTVRTRQTILYAVVCHLAALDGRGDGAVGRVASAAEGSVNTSFDYGATTARAAWWTQTQCGAAAWALLKPWRTGGLYFGG